MEGRWMCAHCGDVAHLQQAGDYLHCLVCDGRTSVEADSDRTDRMGKALPREPIFLAPEAEASAEPQPEVLAEVSMPGRPDGA